MTVRTGGWLVGALAGFALVAGCAVALARSPLLHERTPADLDRRGPSV
ncbi:hypothetical protein GCM10017691_11340 [Pseudonocardia petroleophila]|uniref:Uncharacterized protein n=1 Tax=Pseudonocardia petroleophila TaxID=37331 RepID=A0A7G7MIV6_9PSEU|nr:hypothetical protein [Pseudonocardia petroleophila]QNG52717.1 hypothetical protein H6H00_01180 [Pseudonocardia petroleophila]